jgi:hypothetical protein
MAGELAIEYGIVPWPEGAAFAAAVELFRAWGRQRGTKSNREPTQVLQEVANFLDRHGDSRFSPRKTQRRFVGRCEAVKQKPYHGTAESGATWPPVPLYVRRRRPDGRASRTAASTAPRWDVPASSPGTTPHANAAVRGSTKDCTMTKIDDDRFPARPPSIWDQAREQAERKRYPKPRTHALDQIESLAGTPTLRREQINLQIGLANAH